MSFMPCMAARRVLVVSVIAERGMLPVYLATRAQSMLCHIVQETRSIRVSPPMLHASMVTCGPCVLHAFAVLMLHASMVTGQVLRAVRSAKTRMRLCVLHVCVCICVCVYVFVCYR